MHTICLHTICITFYARYIIIHYYTQLHNNTLYTRCVKYQVFKKYAIAKTRRNERIFRKKRDLTSSWLISSPSKLVDEKKNSRGVARCEYRERGEGAQQPWIQFKLANLKILAYLLASCQMHKFDETGRLGDVTRFLPRASKKIRRGISSRGFLNPLQPQPSKDLANNSSLFSNFPTRWMIFLLAIFPPSFGPLSL